MTSPHASPAARGLVAEHAIVVPGAPVDCHGRPRPPLRARLEAALELALREPDAVVIVSGAAVTGHVAEAPAMARWLQARGLEARRIVVESRARSTIENADRVAPLLRELGVARVTVVSQRGHARRMRFNLRVALRALGVSKIELSVAAAATPAHRRGRRRRAYDVSSEGAKLAYDVLLRLVPSLRHLLPWRADRGPSNVGD